AVFTVACLGYATGCSSTVAPRTWATTVCQSLAPWRAAISRLNETAQTEMASTTTVTDTRTHVLELLDGGRFASQTAPAPLAVAAGGVPDVTGGGEIEKRFITALAAVRDAYGRAATTVGNLSTDDPSAFYTGVRSAFAQLNTDYSKAGADPSAIASAELQADF